MNVFITGGTGYIGQRLIPLLLARGHSVSAVVRAGSERRLPVGVVPIVADPLLEESYADKIGAADVFIHLIGTPHPSPAKAKQFHEVDLVSIEVATKAASAAGVPHFIYVSVAHPAPMMKEFIAVRSEGERLLQATGMNATFVRPWYVLGPGRSLALFAAPVLLDLRMPALDPRVGAAPRSHHGEANVGRAHVVDRESAQRGARSGRPGNPEVEQISGARLRLAIFCFASGTLAPHEKALARRGSIRRVRLLGNACSTPLEPGRVKAI